MELGNLLYGNTPCDAVYELENRKIVYNKWWNLLLEECKCDSYGICETTKSGEFDCDMFTIRPYDWNFDGEKEALANFEYKPINLKLSWYKYPFRDTYLNQKLSNKELSGIFKECFNFIKNFKKMEKNNEK